MNNLDILYEDNHIIVVIKPVDILSQSDITKDIDMLTLVKQYVKKKYHKPGNVYIGLVHRLDRPVSGVMVFARTSKAASRLSEDIKKHNFKKTYLAVVHGRVEKKCTLTDYLCKEENGNTIISNSKNGKYAELSFECLNYDHVLDVSLVKIILKTGRHHQIRVQFASRNHPLLGDKRYGIDDRFDNIGLFAYKLEFTHPVTKEKLIFSALPTDIDGFKNFDVSNFVKE